jgi:hypothetical protein
MLFPGAKKAKTEILNEFVDTTAMHLKDVIKLLDRMGRSSRKRKKGCPSYSPKQVSPQTLAQRFTHLTLLSQIGCRRQCLCIHLGIIGKVM